MIRSMTAYGRAVRDGTPDGRNISVELKSVNNRYFDCGVKIPRVYAFLEDRVRQYIQSRGISRGKVDVLINVDITEKVGTSIDVDMSLAKSYIEALRKLRDEFGLPDDITVSKVARNQDIFIVRKPEEDAERDWQLIKPVLDEAVSAFLKVRETEGERLKADILTKLSRIEELTGQIKSRSEEDISSYRQKFEARLTQLISDNSVELNPQMVLTECAIYADRVAIDEELVRLGCHFEAFRSMLDSDEPVGRKSDFLLQEINRETNTIGSKVSDAQIASLVVEVKSELEKIREQVQNIE